MSLHVDRCWSGGTETSNKHLPTTFFFLLFWFLFFFLERKRQKKKRRGEVRIFEKVGVPAYSPQVFDVLWYFDARLSTRKNRIIQRVLHESPSFQSSFLVRKLQSSPLPCLPSLPPLKKKIR